MGVRGIVRPAKAAQDSEHYPRLFKPGTRGESGTKKRVILSGVLEAKDLARNPKAYSNKASLEADDGFVSSLGTEAIMLR